MQWSSEAHWRLFLFLGLSAQKFCICIYSIRGWAISEFAKGMILRGIWLSFDQKSKNEHTLTLNLFPVEKFN